MTGVCFLTVKKCFDTINHTILLEKLRKYGILESELSWFRSYLEKRKQRVSCNGKLSKVKEVDIGVPQGSVLGPILFLIYINDLSQHMNGASINMFADDVSFYTTGKTVNEVQSKLQKQVNSVGEWYNSNKLSLNADKSNVVLVHTKRNREIDKLDITLNEKNLEQVSTVKYLGIKLNENLSWKNQIEFVCKKVSPQLAALRRLSGQVPCNILSQIYLTVIQPSIDYGSIVWGNYPDIYKNRIQGLQNNAARTVTGNFDYVNYRGIDLVRQLRWQTFEERQIYNTSKLTYKCIKGDVPFYLQNYFTFRSAVQNYNLRCNSDVMVPHPNKEIFKKSFSYHGAKVWNSLPTNLKMAESTVHFKKLYKQHYFV